MNRKPFSAKFVRGIAETEAWFSNTVMGRKEVVGDYWAG